MLMENISYEMVCVPVSEVDKILTNAKFPLYYSIIGLSDDCSQEEIKKRYYALARYHHPDKNTDRNSDNNMKLLNSAYDILKNPITKTQYDSQLKAARYLVETIMLISPIINLAIFVGLPYLTYKMLRWAAG